MCIPVRIGPCQLPSLERHQEQIPVEFFVPRMLALGVEGLLKHPVAVFVQCLCTLCKIGSALWPGTRIVLQELVNHVDIEAVSCTDICISAALVDQERTR
jgi:hypothetical protein